MIKLLRHPEGSDGGGGGGEAAATQAPSSPASAVPQASTTSDNPMERMAQSLEKIWNKDEGNPGLGPDTNEEGSKGSEEEGGTPPEETPAWDEDDKKLLAEKGLDKLAHSEEAKKLLKIYRDAEKGIHQFSQSNSNAIERLKTIDGALLNGDIKALKEMGYDIQVETRTPDKMIEEVHQDYNNLSKIWSDMLEQLGEQPPQVVEALKNAAYRLSAPYQAKADSYAKEQEALELESRIAKKLGVEPAKGGRGAQIYENLSKKAEANVTSLVQKELAAGDVNAENYWKEVKAATDFGGPLHALGINLPKAFGTNENTAQFFHEVGKALYIKKDLPNILASARKQWEKEAAMKRQGNGAPKGGSSGNSPSNDNKPVSALSAMMRQFSGRKE